MLRKVVPILLVIVWLMVIFNFSSDEGAVSQSKSQVITDYIHQNYDEVAEKVDENLLHYLVRKSAHVTLYFVLCLVVMNALYFGGFRGKGLFVRAFLICVFYASLDEIHQRFISNRTGKLTDVYIDSIGIILAIALSLTMERAYNYIRRRFD